MNHTKILTGLLILVITTNHSPAWAEHQNIDQETLEYNTIDIAGYEVPVVEGGLYDRFRSNPPLSVIEAESPATDLSWFKTLEKTKVDVGFETYSPNFYYDTSKVTVIYTADIYSLRNKIPVEIRDYIQPLEVFPGRGLVALTAYAYHYCDNDSYNEISLSIVTNRAGKPNHGIFSLLAQMSNNDYWGYILKLPVDTELARVRGVVGYNLPKWLTDISYQERPDTTTFAITDEETGEVDFVLETDNLNALSDSPVFVSNSFANLSNNGTPSYGTTISRHLKYASTMNADKVRLVLSDGSFSRYLKSLDIGMMFRYEYVPHFQSALYTTKPLSSFVQLR